MIPKSLFQYNEILGRIIPNYLDNRDIPWLESLINEFESFDSRPVRDLNRRLLEPLGFKTPKFKYKMALHVLNKLYKSKSKPALSPKELRYKIFREAMKVPLKTHKNYNKINTIYERKKYILGKIAGNLEVQIKEIEESLFADLASEQLLVAPEEKIAPTELVLKTNLALVQGLIGRASEVQIKLLGNARAIVRHAKLKGLICTVHKPREDNSGEDICIYLSGPLALFQKTCMYGKALAELVPMLSWCKNFELRAKCSPEDNELELVIKPGDPIFPQNKPKEFDSKIELRFFRDFQKKAIDWDLIREPKPFEAGSALIFPDFMIKHRRKKNLCWYLEIVGYWTTEYLQNKISKLKKAKINNMIICIDRSLKCSNEDLRLQGELIWYSKRIDVNSVLKIIE